MPLKLMRKLHRRHIEMQAQWAKEAFGKYSFWPFLLPAMLFAWFLGLVLGWFVTAPLPLPFAINHALQYAIAGGFCIFGVRCILVVNLEDLRPWRNEGDERILERLALIFIGVISLISGIWPFFNPNTLKTLGQTPDYELAANIANFLG